jgi:hypothetical protein
MEAMESRWLYTSRSSSTDRMVRGTGGAELVRAATPVRPVVRGVALEVEGEAGTECSARDSLDKFEVLLDLDRCGSRSTPMSSISPIEMWSCTLSSWRQLVAIVDHAVRESK